MLPFCWAGEGVESHDIIRDGGRHGSSDGPHTSDEPVGAEEDLRVQVQAEGHDFEDPQTELLAAQEEGGLDLLKVAQRT